MGRGWNFFGILFLGAVLLSQSNSDPEGSSAVPTLEVVGNSSAFKLTPELLHQLERKKVEVRASEKEPASVYEGVWLRDLLWRAFPKGLRSRANMFPGWLSWKLPIIIAQFFLWRS